MSVSTYTPDSTKILHTAYADFVSRQIGRMIHVVQYDDNLPLLAVKLFSDGQPYTIPSNAEVSIKLGKSDGKFVYNPALGCDSDRHIAYFEITYQMVVLAEKISPIIEVRIGSSIAASSSIGIIIDRNPIQREDIESTSEWKAIQEAVSYAKEAISSAASASASRSAASASESNALTYRNVAQTAAGQASNSAAAAATSEANIRGVEERVSDDLKESTEKLMKIQEFANQVSTDKSSVENSEANAKKYMDNAVKYSDNAKVSEDNAKVSETNAKESEQNALSYRDTAQTAASDASNFASAAAISASNANESETNASASEVNAAKSESKAAEKASEADVYSRTSKSYAIGEGNIRSDEEHDNAKYYSLLASEAEQKAKVSEEAVVVSMAEAAKQSEEARKQAEASSVSANNATQKASEAAQSAVSAGSSADAAAASASSASDSMLDAENFAELSESWAVGGKGIREGEETDNSRYYAQQAKESAKQAEALSNIKIATVDNAGIVKPDGDTITVDEDGTLHGSSKVDIATEENTGVVKPDGDTITVDEDGTIHASERKLEEHAEVVVSENDGVHGLRYNDNRFKVKDAGGNWVQVPVVLPVAPSEIIGALWME